MVKKSSSWKHIQKELTSRSMKEYVREMFYDIFFIRNLWPNEMSIITEQISNKWYQPTMGHVDQMEVMN
jgi:hypothetical protein